MRCQRCGKDLGSSARCSFCGFENSDGNVREMTKTEKNFYNGVTIDVGSTDSGSQKNFRTDSNFESSGNANSQKNFYTNTAFVNLGGTGFFSRLFEKFVRGLMNNNLLAKIIAGFIFVALAGIFFFVALPVMFFILALGVALYIYARFTGRI